ncbi:MAG: CoA transferase [SAR202 cluster bacterium]|nr:CoA transferase [SAR202 cluster bacterium]MDP6663654.1 CoA transferase [SAR202 cluster bacterium]MDP6798544.1 CoA transferase [SAR202 cluster bacterium]
MSQELPSTNSPRALEGVRVLDISGPAGFYCTKLMADLGADVVRVDPPESDPDHSPGPFFGDEPDENQSLYRWHFHANKRSVALDISSAPDREVFDSLLAAADVLVDTLRPSEAQRLDLDAQTLRESHPALVHTTITGFGTVGPYVDYKATDIVAQAMGGLMALTGYPEDPPNQVGGEQAYHVASLHAAVGTLMALLSRDLDGKGADVQIALQDSISMATLQTANFNAYTWLGVLRHRTGLNHAFSSQSKPTTARTYPPTLYQCLDGWIAYAQHADPPLAWQHFVEWLAEFGAEQELADPRFEDLEYRRERQWRIDIVLTEFAAQHTAQELYHSAQRYMLLCSPVQNVEDLTKDEQLRDREFFVDVEHPELDRSFKYPGAPYKLSETPWQLRRRAPLVGEHSREVLGDWLGLSDAQAEAMLAQGESGND